MIPALLGRKVGMTRVYDEDGKNVPVTVVEVGPCTVTQVKTTGSDGYEAVQLGYEPAKPKHSTMALIGHAAKSGSGPMRHFREVRLTEPTDAEAGSEVKIDVFGEVAFVDVVATSKGKGTQGPMKRHNFGGQPASHGVERKHRSPGSIGANASNLGTGKIKKGIRMAGRMGNERVTSRNHRLVKVLADENLLLIKGAVPGPNGGLVFVKKSKTAKNKAAA